MPFFIPILVAAVAATVFALADSKPEVEDVITLVGPTSSGKSLLGNELLGRHAFAVDAGHGTTREVAKAHYRHHWMLADTPGILDGEELANVALQAALRSKIVVLCIEGEMYRPVLDWLRQYLARARTDRQIMIIPYLTKQDVREQSMTSADRRRVEGRVSEQFEQLRGELGGSRVEIAAPILGSLGDRSSIERELDRAIRAINS